MPRLPAFGHDRKVNALLGAGHFLSHFYVLCLPPMFIAWQQAFGVSFAELGLATALMSGAAALLQTPMGFLVDRFGARLFLVAGTLLMALSVAAMGLATAFWQVVVLAVLSGVGNSVIHPADYAILSGSVSRERIGRSFAFHTFNGHVGFAAAPPVTALLIGLFGWRATLLVVGGLGLPVVLTILAQSRILVDQARTPQRRAAGGGASLLLTRSILLFFAFFMVSAMATAGIQSWLITILHQARGMSLEAASASLTAYMVGMMAGVLLGGWVADRSDRHLAFAVGLTIVAALLLFLVDAVTMTDLMALLVLLAAGVMVGASRTPRDVMVKDAAPAGQIGKVFGFVSAGLSLGAAIMPVPYGILIDAGHPDLVLAVVAVLLLVSLLFVGGARAGTTRAAVPVPAE